jgi:threonyl-tRNA synthetase
VHAALGVKPAGFRLSLRGDSAKYVGSPADWSHAESLLREALAGRSYVEAEGEAAFYGPKIDIQVVDAAGRESTLSTIQVDFHQPARFDLSYVDHDGERRRPVMVHRSLVGSMERLFAYLIEAHAGAFPVWYAPVQLVVLPVGSEQVPAASAIARSAVERGLRARVRAEGSLGARVRDAARARIPYAAVVGSREAADGAVALRLRDGRALDPMPAGAALDLVADVSAAHSPTLLPA